MAIASDPQRLRRAVSQLEDGGFAATSAAPRAARATLWGDLLWAAGFSPNDLSVPAYQAGVGPPKECVAVEPAAITFCAKKVAVASGDARRALQARVLPCL